MNDLARRLHYQMLRIRMVEEKIAKLYPEQEIRCPMHLYIGQEAIAVGVCANLTKDDYVMSNHRSHGHYLAKGGDLKAMMAELYGKATGCSGGRGGSMHLIDLSVGFLGATPIVGATIPIAVGAALGSVMKGENRVAVAFFGDAAVEEGVFHESLNFAALKKLPVVFVCENNLYSANSPLSVRQPAERTIWQLAQGYGILAWKANGNNVVDVYNLTGLAVNRARGGGGPSLLEFKTYRWLEHCGPNPDPFRPEEELLLWKKQCPIARMKIEDGQVVKEIEAEIEGAVAFAKESPWPEI